MALWSKELVFFAQQTQISFFKQNIRIYYIHIYLIDLVSVLKEINKGGRGGPGTPPPPERVKQNICWIRILKQRSLALVASCRKNCLTQRRGRENLDDREGSIIVHLQQSPSIDTSIFIYKGPKETHYNGNLDYPFVELK